jgi:hypothetical protein
VQNVYKHISKKFYDTSSINPLDVWKENMTFKGLILTPLPLVTLGSIHSTYVLHNLLTNGAQSASVFVSGKLLQYAVM